jgi:NADH-ubiquinone oxidoreductase chain 4
MQLLVFVKPCCYLLRSWLGWNDFILLASLPMLVGILFVYNSLGSLYLFLLCGSNSLVGGLFFVCIVFAFLVKIPMFTVHL